MQCIYYPSQGDNHKRLQGVCCPSFGGKPYSFCLESTLASLFVFYLRLLHLYVLLSSLISSTSHSTETCTHHPTQLYRFYSLLCHFLWRYQRPCRQRLSAFCVWMRQPCASTTPCASRTFPVPSRVCGRTRGKIHHGPGMRPCLRPSHHGRPELDSGTELFELRRTASSPRASRCL